MRSFDESNILPYNLFIAVLLLWEPLPSFLALSLVYYFFDRFIFILVNKQVETPWESPLPIAHMFSEISLG